MSFRRYTYALDPNTSQRVLISKNVGCARLVYNELLSEKIEHYKETGKLLKNTPAHLKEKYEFLSEVDSLALANSQMNLEIAFSNFFKNPRKVGYPKYKAKKHSRNCYTTNNVNNSIRIERGKLKLPKLGYVRFRYHRDLPADAVIKAVAVEILKSGRINASILAAVPEKSIDQICDTKTIDEITIKGLDYSSPYLYVDDEGNSPTDFTHFYRDIEDRLAKEQRKLSNMRKGSNNREKQCRKIARLYEKAADRRKDFLEKETRKLADRYDYIAVEDIDMKAMSQALKLGKATMDNGYGMFRHMLAYKLEAKGGKLITIDKWEPTSKRCNKCGHINTITLKDRVITCVNCGNTYSRDENAGKNIKDVGLKILKEEIMNRRAFGDSSYCLSSLDGSNEKPPLL